MRTLCTLLTLSFCGCSGAGESTKPVASGPTVATPYNDVRIASDDPGAPDMLDLTIPSESLGRDVHVRLLLPTSFAREPERTYPVLFLLHGAEEPLGYRAWTEHSHVESLVLPYDVLVVMPDAGIAGWYSDWQEGCAANDAQVDEMPAWEEFHTVELPAILASSYRANGTHAVAGLSMGGMGATSYAARHDGLFRAAASYSGALHTQTFSDVLHASLAAQGCSDVDAVWGDIRTHVDVWAAHDPFALADRLTALPLYVAAGDGSPGPLDAPGASGDLIELLANQVSQEFVSELTRQGGGDQLTTHFYGAGTHSWPYWARELELSLPMLLESLDIAP